MTLPNNEFEDLRKLLACKRYEQPPPGYFRNFSDRVISRIERDELIEYSSWWQWLINKFDARPIVACVYGVAVSGLLLAGFRLSQIFDTEVAANAFPGGLLLATTPGSSAILPAEFRHTGYVETSVSTYPTSLSPAFRSESQNLLFSGNRSLVQPVSFSPSY
jgi:hypothetical protein